MLNSTLMDRPSVLMSCAASLYENTITHHKDRNLSACDTGDETQMAVFCKGFGKQVLSSQGLEAQWSLEWSSVASQQCEQRDATCIYRTGQAAGERSHAQSFGSSFRYRLCFLLLLSFPKCLFHLRVSCDTQEHRTRFIGIILNQTVKAQWI